MASKKDKLIGVLVIIVLSIAFILMMFSCDYYYSDAIDEYENENYLEAISLLEEAEANRHRAEDNDDIYFMLGNCYYELEMYEEAIDYYEDAISINSGDVMYYTNLGICYAKTGEYEKAMTEYFNALDIDPDYAELNSSIGSLYIRLEHPELSIKYFEKAIEIDPTVGTAYGNCAYAYALIGDIEKAYEYLNKSIEHDYQNAETVREMIEELEYYNY